MWLDVVDLRDFYASPLGRLVARLVGQRLSEFWPPQVGARVLGLGFATPYLPHLEADAERVLAVMPAGQGVVRWPEAAPAPVPGRVCLADEANLPFPDRSIDRLLIVHGLEGNAQPRHLMRECWRVLADGGRVIVVVANRSSLWARFEASPFAHGQPYSMSQLTKLLRDGMFAPRQTARALFLPPFFWRLFNGWGAGLDRAGSGWFPTFAGVHIVEAEKQIYATPWNAAPAKVKKAVVGVGSVTRASEQIPPAR